jgi:hypothetical protein
MIPRFFVKALTRGQMTTTAMRLAAEEEKPDLIHQTNTMRWLVSKLLRDTGIRPVAPPTELNRPTHYRFEIIECHGFRKFFESNAFKAGMNNMYIRRLMGQKSGLEDSYLKIGEEELLEGSGRHTGYVDIIDQVTNNDEYRLRIQVEILKVEKNTWKGAA